VSAREETAPTLPVAEAHVIALWQEAHAADEGILYCYERIAQHLNETGIPIAMGAPWQTMVV
jgi:hypothetical protein